MNIERRYTAARSRVGIQKRADGAPVIAGYAAVFYRADDPGTEYRLWDDVYERIKPGAFDAAIGRDDVRGLFNHDPSEILGRSTAGTLRLSVDDTGLRYEIDPPDWAGKYVESIGRGDITGSSFGFVPETTAYRDEKRDGRDVIVIEREAVSLFDVSPVTFPAYESTSAGLRSAGPVDSARAEVEAWRRRTAEGRARIARDAVEAVARCVELALARRGR
jgi:HK97 family phage prohead protease